MNWMKYVSSGSNAPSDVAAGYIPPAAVLLPGSSGKTALRPLRTITTLNKIGVVRLTEGGAMLGIDNYPAFVLAGILLNITPGADTLYILARSVAQGRLAGIVSVCGIGTGALVHIAFAAFGLSAVLASSAVAYDIIRYAGAAYLVFIGIQTLRRRKASETSSPSNEKAKRKPKPRSAFKIYYQGFLTNLLNPKIALFFLSFLPQFVAPDNPHGPVPFLILGFTFLTTGSIWCFFLAFSAAYMTQTLRRNEKLGRWLQRSCGAVFIALGLQVALKR